MAILGFFFSKLLKHTKNYTKRTSHTCRRWGKMLYSLQNEVSRHGFICLSHHPQMEVERGFLSLRPQFIDMETEAQKRQLTSQKARGQETSVQAPSPSAVRAFTRTFYHLVLQGMRIRFQGIWPTTCHFSATWAKRETRGMAETMLAQGEPRRWEVWVRGREGGRANMSRKPLGSRTLDRRWIIYQSPL